MSQDHSGRGGGDRGHTPSEPGAFARYGNTPGQLEGLPMTDDGHAVVVSSPPYSGNEKHDYGVEERDKRRLGENFKGRGRGSFRHRLWAGLRRRNRSAG